MRRIHKKALTLVEIMVVTAIILIAILALFGAYTSSLILVVQARERSIATDDLEDILEHIKTLPFAHITNPANGGFSDGGGVNEATIGGFQLENEVMTISYPQGTAADPLEIEAQVSWSGRYSRSDSLTFRTMRSSGL